MQYLCILVPNWLDLLALYTVDSGYYANAPITLSGKKYVFNRMYMLNKQVSKYVVMLFF